MPNTDRLLGKHDVISVTSTLVFFSSPPSPSHFLHLPPLLIFFTSLPFSFSSPPSPSLLHLPPLLIFFTSLPFSFSSLFAEELTEQRRQHFLVVSVGGSRQRDWRSSSALCAVLLFLASSRTHTHTHTHSGATSSHTRSLALCLSLFLLSLSMVHPVPEALLSWPAARV